MLLPQQQRPSHHATVYKYREIRSVDPAEFERRLRRSVLFTSPERSTDAFETQLRSVVTQLLDEMAPLRTSRKRKSKPITRWLSRDAITAKRTRRKLERRWARSKLESDRLAFRNACRYANKLIVQSRASYFRQQLRLRLLQTANDDGKLLRNYCMSLLLTVLVLALLQFLVNHLQTFSNQKLIT